MGRVLLQGSQQIHVGGRIKPSRPHHIRLHAASYGLNLANWPTTPPLTNFSTLTAAQPVLRDILGNDTLGDCTEADQFHRQALRQAAGGQPVFHPTLDQVVAIYSRDSGYDGTPGTDNGCDETTVMSNACAQGIPSSNTTLDAPVGFLLIDASNRDLVRACVSMFVGASICMGLPDEWISPFPSSDDFTWDVPQGGFDPANGHCFTLMDQADNGLRIGTWGLFGGLTYDALAAGCSEENGGALYVVVDQEILQTASQQAPDGLDWNALISDFQSLPTAQ